MKPPFSLYIGLVHYPVVNKLGQKITTSVTNLDLHDISRSAKTFGAEKFFVITPLEEQKKLVMEVLEHWRSGAGKEFNPHRADALSRVEIMPDVEAVMDSLEKIHGNMPLIAMTSAKFEGQDLTSAGKFFDLATSQGAGIILFGTGYGLDEDLLSMADCLIEPILGVQKGDNHLSVRSAVAITLDRLLNGR